LLSIDEIRPSATAMLSRAKIRAFSATVLPCAALAWRAGSPNT
jgi:hypothetical protein